MLYVSKVKTLKKNTMQSHFSRNFMVKYYDTLVGAPHWPFGEWVVAVGIGFYSPIVGGTLFIFFVA